MANPEHLAILKKGVEAWNQWRTERPDIQPDLSGADLIGVKLNQVNFMGVNLIGAQLRMAGLNGATLNSAILSGADLRDADLTSANLNGAFLIATNLGQAEMSYADFSDAALCGATLVNVDLRKVINLDTIKHKGPSSIGIDTLYRSQGKIPEAFLRGCGVPDQMIEYAKSLTNTPIQYYSCFISYSHKDEEFAERIHNDLQFSGVRCWYAPHDMKIGDKIRITIDESIRTHDKLLLILSKHSVESEWIEHEAEHALDLEKERKKNVLFPVCLDDAVMGSATGWAGNVKRQRHIGDFSRWKEHDAYKAAFDRLLRDLKAG
jgi:hypothetical protein